MSSFHTPDKKLGELAARANPKLLLLTHVIPSGVADSAVLAGIRSGGYKGKIAIGHDLERF
jgi:ribonuclease BN (tRNA processing enzyme)